MDLLFNHFGKQNNSTLHDHSMLLFAEHKQQTAVGGNALTDGFGNKDWQVTVFPCLINFSRLLRLETYFKVVRLL